jgi:hypothetical protein
LYGLDHSDEKISLSEKVTEKLIENGKAFMTKHLMEICFSLNVAIFQLCVLPANYFCRVHLTLKTIHDEQTNYLGRNSGQRF